MRMFAASVVASVSLVAAEPAPNSHLDLGAEARAATRRKDYPAALEATAAAP